MRYLLLGPDGYSKDIFLKNLVTKKNAELVNIFSDDLKKLELSDVLQTDLFSKAKIFCFRDFVPDYFAEVNEAREKNDIVVLLNSLDKRKKENKELLSSKSVEIKEFILPHGKELDLWIKNKVQELGGSILPEAVDELSIRLGRDKAKEIKAGGKIISTEEIYNLYQAENEVNKLLSYSGSETITKQVVQNLVLENGEVDVFDLTNAIGENQKQKSLDLLQKLLNEQNSGDEKSSIIQLNALLAEQFRSVAMVQDFLNKKITEDDILEKTGWKSGRLFVMKKVAGRFTPKKIRETLNKLEALDQELKTSQTPPKVLLDLIISQLF